ncbi:MAG: replication-associated recombination protein A, partial [Bacteroidia bacterium]|nr:replication-associated recombination protein A [Bacteroidia bacterium]
KLMKELGYGDAYQYAHNYEDNFADHEFLPEEIINTKLYDPGNNQREDAIREFLRSRWKEKYGY